MTIPHKIHIIGSVGSGKTTLARDLSSKLKIACYELDNIVWKRSPTGDTRRTERQRDDYLQEITRLDKWIIEGAHREWVITSLQRADLIIFLDIDYKKRLYRILKRFILQKLGVEKANYKPTLKIFIAMFKWNAQFEKEKPMTFNFLRQFDEKLIILKDNSEIDKHICFYEGG